eukprot:SAG11_NODE_1918_length_4070_cov_2.703097_2_plen_320_part_00
MASSVHLTAKLLTSGTAWVSSPAAGVALQHWPSNCLALRSFCERRSSQHVSGATTIRYGETCAAAELTQALFYAAEEGAPLRPCRNRSLPASWLDAGLLGRALALSVSIGDSSPIGSPLGRSGLQALGVRSNWVGSLRSGVSLARFEQLLSKLRADPALVGRCAVLKAQAEAKGEAHARAALLQYMHGAALLNSVEGEAVLSTGSVRDAWLHSHVPHVTEEAAAGAAARLLRGARSWADEGPDAEALLLALLQDEALSGPPLHSEASRAIGGQRPRGDCVEHVLRSLVDLVVWDAAAQCWAPSRLPKTAPAVWQSFRQR